MALKRLDDERGVSNVYTPGNTQKMQVINEAGAYRLIFTSRENLCDVLDLDSPPKDLNVSMATRRVRIVFASLASQIHDLCD